MVRSRRQGIALYAAMSALMLAGIGVAYGAEQDGSPAQKEAGIELASGEGTSGGNLEGKEQRNGIVDSAIWGTATTDASNGSVNSAHDAWTGLGGTVLLANMMTGEVIFGGVGSGLYGMLLFVLLTVFIAGLMVGRTPEFLGKKIEAREIKLVLVGVLVMPIVVLGCTALAVATSYGEPSIYNPGPQGFSETLYALVSQANNNGSAFAGFTGFVQPNAPGNAGSFGITFADLVGGIALFAGRYPMMIAVLAIAGSLAGKRVAPAGPGTFRTDSPTFVGLLVGVVIIVGALTFFPALLLGPVVQSLSTELF
jgi:K+-transporting ATPase ATPase A chain